MKKIYLSAALILALLAFAGSAVTEESSWQFYQIGAFEKNCTATDLGAGMVYIGTPKGVFRKPLDSESFGHEGVFTFTVVDSNLALWEHVYANNKVIDICIKSDTLYLATEKGVDFADKNTLIWQHVPGFNTYAAQVLAVNSKTIWVSGMDVFLLDGNGGKRGLSVGAASDIFLDSNNHLWAGSRNGIFEYNPASQQLSNRTYDFPGSLADVKFAESQNEIYAGSPHPRITGYGVFVSLKGNSWQRPNGIAYDLDAPVLAMGSDEQGQLWITGSILIYKYAEYLLTPYVNSDISTRGGVDMAIGGGKVFLTCNGQFVVFTENHQQTSSITIASTSQTITTCSVSWMANVQNFKKYRYYYSTNGGAFKPCPVLYQNSPNYSKDSTGVDYATNHFTFTYFNPVLDSTVTVKVVAESKNGSVSSDSRTFTIPRTVGYDTDGGAAWFPGFSSYRVNDFIGNLVSVEKKSGLLRIIFAGKTDVSEVVMEIRPAVNPKIKGTQFTAPLVLKTNQYHKWLEVDLTGFGIELQPGSYYIGFSSDGIGQVVMDCSTISLGHSYYTDYYGRLVPVGSDCVPNLPQYDFLIRLELKDISGITEDDFQPTAPQRFELSRNFPNPFNSSTAFEFSLPFSEEVKIAVVDAAGREIDVLFTGGMPAGKHTLVWDGRTKDRGEAPSGIYLIFVSSASFTGIKKMMLVR